MSSAERLMLVFIAIALALWIAKARANTDHRPTPQTRQDQTANLIPNNPYTGMFRTYQNRNRPPFKSYNPNLIIHAPNLAK